MNNVNINNEQQSTTGNIKNETTTPQVELLFRKRFLDLTTGFYWDRQGLYAPSEGSGVQPYYKRCCGTSSGSGDSCRFHTDCPEDHWCLGGVCVSNAELMPETGGAISNQWNCGDTVSFNDPMGRNHLVGSDDIPDSVEFTSNWSLDGISYGFGLEALNDPYIREDIGWASFGAFLTYVGFRSGLGILGALGVGIIGTNIKSIRRTADRYRIEIYTYTYECN